MREKPVLLMLHGGPGADHSIYRPACSALADIAQIVRIQCPTLVLGGEDDPMHPIESQADIAAALPPHLVQFERFADFGHAVMPDAPERTTAVIRDFVLRAK
jgi:alpha-beta hydrolase superfamily lysophospholipase